DIRARPRGGLQELEVRDSGPGFPAEMQAGGAAAEGERAGGERSDGERSEVERAGGVGLSNARARLAQLYPGLHRFELGAGPEGGARVRITIPFRRAPERSPADARPKLERPA
ncbi:MAG TPA: ATP-binding protein, partial [Longimicrobiales bacterium]|nr:ATP-binding protein [Longimicrobiales bacterium]